MKRIALLVLLAVAVTAASCAFGYACVMLMSGDVP